jgi:hypothetical protein
MTGINCPELPMLASGCSNAITMSLIRKTKALKQTTPNDRNNFMRRPSYSQMLNPGANVPLPFLFLGFEFTIEGGFCTRCNVL